MYELSSFSFVVITLRVRCFLSLYLLIFTLVCMLGVLLVLCMCLCVSFALSVNLACCISWPGYLCLGKFSALQCYLKYIGTKKLGNIEEHQIYKQVD